MEIFSRKIFAFLELFLFAIERIAQCLGKPL